MSRDINFRLLPLGPFGDSHIVKCAKCGDNALFGPGVGEVFRQYIHRVFDGRVEDCNARTRTFLGSSDPSKRTMLES
jgi:hypothetical protein